MLNYTKEEKMDFRDSDYRTDGRKTSVVKSSEAGGEGSEKANLSAVGRYIKGVHFPAHKDDLVNQAKENAAPKDVLNILDHFSDKNYKSVVEITKEVLKTHS